MGDVGYDANTISSLGGDLAHFLDALADGVIFLDRDWRITYANENARRISRIAPEDLNGPSHWELYPATVGTEQETVYRRSMEERIPLEHEFYYPPFDVWIKLRTIPIPSGIAVHYQDISRLKGAEAKRKESAEQLRQVFEATTDAIFTLDREYRFKFLNRRARELLAPSGDVLGKVIWEAFPGAVYEGSPYQSTYKKAMDEGVAGSFEAYYPEPLNFWVSVEARPSDDGVIVFFRDVTGQRRAAEELLRQTAEAERQAAEIEAVYRTAPIGLALFDPIEFRYLKLNDRQSAFFGLTPEEILGRTLTEMAPIPGLRELFEQVRAGTPVVNYPLEGELVNRPGEHRYWTVNYFPVYAPDGSVQAISAASLEITQQKRAERALMQSEKLAAVGRLASSISHEINNPLESVTNLLYLIAMDGTLPPELKMYLELAQSEVARVSQIATQTLRFHRQTQRPTPVSGAALLEPALTLYEGRLRNAGISLERRLRDATPVLCFENEIRQVLSNLIGNAIDAMRGGGRMLLRSRDATGPDGTRGMRITVADTGSGMSNQTRKRVFEPFFTTKELSGTGLGLWISAEIVARHHGRLSVRSSEGKERHGTVFSLFLPQRSDIDTA